MVKLGKKSGAQLTNLVLQRAVAFLYGGDGAKVQKPSSKLRTRLYTSLLPLLSGKRVALRHSTLEQFLDVGRGPAFTFVQRRMVVPEIHLREVKDLSPDTARVVEAAVRERRLPLTSIVKYRGKLWRPDLRLRVKKGEEDRLRLNVGLSTSVLARWRDDLREPLEHRYTILSPRRRRTTMRA